MNIVFKKIKIIDTNSPYNDLVKDILISNGIITKIEDNIHLTADKIIEPNNLFISPGWVDIFSNFCDPGFEYKETLTSGANAANLGGYTTVFTLPNTKPSITTKTQVEYIKNASEKLPIHIHPLGAVTKNVEGNELAEMYDMQQSGAIAFTDGLHPIQQPELLLKALQYVKATNAVIIQLPILTAISKYGLINEGIHSTQMGLPGMPDISEHIIIQRDIEILRYTNSQLHITGISTAKSIDLIRAAKAEGLNITCSVTPYHLFFCDEDIVNYNTNLKVNPPLRTQADKLALQAAVLDETIDCIASHHFPEDWDNKACEFQYAAFGMIGLQTTYTAIQTILPALSNNALVNLLSNNARNIFNLPNASIIEGATAELTVFSKTENTILTETSNKSKSFNTPFINIQLQGKIFATFVKQNLFVH